MAGRRASKRLTRATSSSLRDLRTEVVLLGTGARQRFPHPRLTRSADGCAHRPRGDGHAGGLPHVQHPGGREPQGRRRSASLKPETQPRCRSRSTARCPISPPLPLAATSRCLRIRGKTVVLYFYPKDNTPGCTTEGSDFADAQYASSRRPTPWCVGVSRDSLKSHEGFKAKMKFPFELISRPRRKAVRTVRRDEDEEHVRQPGARRRAQHVRDRRRRQAAQGMARREGARTMSIRCSPMRSHSSRDACHPMFALMDRPHR